MISRSVHPRPPPPRGRAPLFRKQKQRAAGAKFWSNHCETGGFSCILATQATAQPPPYPIWTDPTDPARRPSDRPIGPVGPYSWAPLGLGLTALRARAPSGPHVFSVFVFSRPPAASDPWGRALTGRSKNLRPVFCIGQALLIISNLPLPHWAGPRTGPNGAVRQGDRLVITN